MADDTGGRATDPQHWWIRARRDILEQLIATHFGTATRLRILEAGCGDGAHLAMLRRFGEVRAFEGETGARDRAAQVSGAEVVAGTLPGQVPFEGESFDLILVTGALAHGDDPVGALAALGERLAPGGRIVAAVPARPWLWSARDRRNHGMHRFAKADLHGAVRRAGLRVNRAFYFGSGLYPLAVARRLTKKVLRRQTPDDRMPPAWLNEILYTLAQAERQSLGLVALPFGMALYAEIGPLDEVHTPRLPL